jgi:hypothetical protein
MRKSYLWALAGALAFGVNTLSPVSAAAPPAGWKAEDIGGAEGGSTDVTGEGAAAVWTVTGLGIDIWGAADSFHFAYTNLPGDGGITARILEAKGGHDDGWAKTGTMLRENTNGESRSAYLVYCNGENYPPIAGGAPAGRAFEPSFRVDEGATPNRGAGGDFGPAADSDMVRRIDGGLGPLFIRTQRKGQVFSHWASEDGKVWKLISEQTIEIDPGTPILAGLAACSHDGDVPYVAKFDNVSVSAEVVERLPSPQRVQAFPGTGAVLITYGAVSNATGYNIYRREVGQAATAAVKVNAQPTANTWFIDDNAGAGLANDKPLLYTVRAVFAGGVEAIDSAEVVVTPQAPLFGRFYRHDIGTRNPGSATIEGNVLKVVAAGGDIWDQADGGTYIMAPVSGDYTVSAKLNAFPKETPETDGFAKAGVMIRMGLGLGDPYAYIFSSATRDPNIHFECRRTFLGGTVDDGGGNSGQPGPGVDEVQFPLWLRLTKTGSDIAGAYSNDGSNYTEVGEPVNFGRTPAVTFTGIASTSHNDAGRVESLFDAAYGIPIQQ